MCGIFASNNPQIKDSHLGQINKRLAFRGPDSQSGLMHWADWKFYHSRLSIIAPIEEFSQPFVSELGDIIVFNGEILNFKDLAEKYQIEDTRSDTAVLSHLLSIDDFDLDEIDGFFALVRVDRLGQLTHCARDRFGVKPMFVHQEGEYLTISSEASILSDLFGLSYSEYALNEYEVFRAPVFASSYFEKVESVTPGKCLINGIYFDPIAEFDSNYSELPEITGCLKKIISDSIDSRMVSDVPVGLLFSGGIDSNLINSCCKSPLRRFTGGFAQDYDMRFASSQRENGMAKDLTLVEVSANQFRQRMKEMVILRKEPLSVPNEVILSFLAEAWSNDGGKVLISGEAADEFFAGYDRIFRWAASIKEFEVEKFLEYYCYTTLDEIPLKVIEHTRDFFCKIRHLGPFEMVRFFFVTKHLPILFRRLDFALMYHGVEGREPLASKAIFKLAMKCGPSSLFRGVLGKLPLRLLAEREIDSEFAFAKKVGFPIDLGLIFKNRQSLNNDENYKIWRDSNLKILE